MSFHRTFLHRTFLHRTFLHRTSLHKNLFLFYKNGLYKIRILKAKPLLLAKANYCIIFTLIIYYFVILYSIH